MLQAHFLLTAAEVSMETHPTLAPGNHMHHLHLIAAANTAHAHPLHGPFMLYFPTSLNTAPVVLHLLCAMLSCRAPLVLPARLSA